MLTPDDFGLSDRHYRIRGHELLENLKSSSTSILQGAEGSCRLVVGAFDGVLMLRKDHTGLWDRCRY